MNTTICMNVCIYIYRNRCNIERENCSSLLGVVNLETQAFECEEDERTILSGVKIYRIWIQIKG